jgi:hypothetical protein
MSGFLSLPPFVAMALLGAATGARAQAPAADPAASAACVEEAPEPPLAAYPDLGPMQVARCPYGRAELTRRFARLLESRALRLELDAVEAAFGLPRLRARISEPRSAWYDLRLRGEGPGGAWEAFINFRESFFPLYGFRPPRLQGTERPTPIDAGDRGSILFSLRLLQPTPETGTPACIPVSALFDRALAAGWQDDTESASFSTHGGPKSVMLTRGDMTWFPGIQTGQVVAPRAEIEAACFVEGRIDQEPTRPEPPISAHEQTLIDRQR